MKQVTNIVRTYAGTRPVHIRICIMTLVKHNDTHEHFQKASLNYNIFVYNRYILGLSKHCRDYIGRNSKSISVPASCKSMDVDTDMCSSSLYNP